MLSYAIANLLLHVILISSFLVIFFFTYASKVEEQIVVRQSTALVQDTIQSMTALVPDSVMDDISTNLVTKLQVPDMSKEDIAIEASNKELLSSTIKMIGIVFVIGIVVVFAMSRFYRFSMTELVIHNLIIVSFVALTEFSFLTYFAKNYDTIDANFVKYKVLETINNRL